jgi:WS/DGAT/MGAT family acyltransferase
VPAFDRLSALDSVFLDIEKDRKPMHIGLTAIFEKGPLRTSSGSLDAELLRRRVSAAVASLPKFRRRIARVPVLHHPVLVDDAVDLDAHLKFVTLARGDDAELRDLVERFYSEPLDHQKPLWEMWVLDGLSEDRFAVVTKAHHCLIDGVSGIAALTSMLRTTPEHSFEDCAIPAVEPAPSGRELLAMEMRRLAGTIHANPAELARRARGIRAGVVHAVRSVFPPASNTRAGPSPQGSKRSIVWLESDLASAHAIGAAASAKVNDVVLATVSGALSRYVARRGESTSRVFRALVPVSTHGPADRDLDNKVSALLVPLPIAEPDPRARLRIVSDTMRAEKASGQVEAIAAAESAADAGWFGLVTAVVRAATLLRSYNVIVTNVRGPDFPLYLLGSRLLAVYPLVPLYGSDTLGIAIVSYDGKMYWGVSGDVAVKSDLHQFGEDLRSAFDALRHELLNQTTPVAQRDARIETAPSFTPRLSAGTLSELGPINWLLCKAISLAAGTPEAHLFTALGRQRRLFRSWLRFAGRLMPGGTFPRRETELVILRVAHLRGCDYELDHHRRLAQGAGIEGSIVERVFDGPDAPGWTDRERDLISAVDSLVHKKDIDNALWQRLRKHYSEPRLVELCLLVGHYEMLATTISALRIPRDSVR